MLKIKKIFFGLSLLFLLILLLMPKLVFAVDPPDPNEAIPQIVVNIGGFTKDSFNPVASGSNNITIEWISQYIGVIYQYGIGLAAVLAVVMIMVGGFLWLMSGGSPEKVGKAKDFITSSLTGLLLALFSFMLLATVNPDLVELRGLDISRPQAPAGGTSGSGSSSVGMGDEEMIRGHLEGQGISINKPPCTSGNSTNCTNVGGLSTWTASGLGALAHEFGGFTVTGGTESGHHYSNPGFEVDIRMNENSELDNWIRSHGSTTGPFGNDPNATKYPNVRLPGGQHVVDFVDEKPVGGTRHWHLRFHD